MILNNTHRITARTTLAVMVLFACLMVFMLPNNVLAWDIFGYYLYLPFTFLYHDIGCQHHQDTLNAVVETYKSTVTLYQVYKIDSTGCLLIKYSSGMALLYAPFFFIGHAIALLFGYKADGFSVPYQWSVLMGSLLYTYIGIWALASVLVKFFKDSTAAITLVLICFGSNYFLHSVMHGQGVMTHNYLFTLYALLLLCTIKWHRNFEMRYALYGGLLCGIITLIRPSEIISVLIPLFWGIQDKNSFREKIQRLRKEWKQLLMFAFLAGLVGFIQMLYWKKTTGHFLYYSYNNPGEGFDFIHPYFRQVWFSFRKGWLVYTPIMIFALLGFLVMLKKQKPFSIAVLMYFIINMYIVSSWSCWWYAASYGQRALIPSYPLMALPLAAFVEATNRKRIVSVLLGFIYLLCIALNLFQTWQMRQGIMDPTRMTRVYYFKIFGKTSVSDADRKLLLIDRSYQPKEQFDPADTATLVKSFDKLIDFEDKSWHPANEFSDSIVNKGSYSHRFSPPQEYSIGVEVPYKNLTSKDYAWIRISADVYITKNPRSLNTDLVANVHHKGLGYKFRSVNLNSLELKPGAWNHISFDYITPEVRSVEDHFNAFFWRHSKDTLYIDNLRVEAYEPRKDP